MKRLQSAILFRVLLSLAGVLWFAGPGLAQYGEITVQFSSPIYYVFENGGSMTIDVVLSASSTNTVTVKYDTFDGTGTAGADYTATSGKLEFAPGETSKTFAVPILPDTLFEDTEWFTVKLSEADNATISPTQGTATVLITDVPPPVAPVTVTAMGGTFSPDPAPINTWVSANLSAQAVRPVPSSGMLNGPTWTWQVVSAQYSDVSEQGPWNDGTLNEIPFIEIVLPSPPPDSTYDYSSAILWASFPIGAYWELSCNAQVGYSDTVGVSYQGAAQAQGKGTPVEVLSLTVTYGATQTNVLGANNWATVCVAKGQPAIIQATLKPDTDDAAAAVKWTGGDPVDGKPRQRAVDRYQSVQTNVKAAAGASSKDLNIWAIWATVAITVEGDAPADAKFNPPYDKDGKYGVWYNADKSVAYGKMVAIATITPAGINAVIKDGFDMKRDRMEKDFKDGAKYEEYYNADWVDDTSDPPFKTTVPDKEDKLYDWDAPSIGLFSPKDSLEYNFNARQYVTWNGKECSFKDGATAKWYWQARWKITETPRVVFANVAAGYLDFTPPNYTKAEYPVPP